MPSHGIVLLFLLLLLWTQVDSLLPTIRLKAGRLRQLAELWDESISGVASDDSLRLGSTLKLFLSRETNDTIAKDRLLSAIREAGTRLQALELLLIRNNLELTDADCKTVLAGVIFSKAEHLLPQFIELARERGKLSSELVYVGIRTAYRRRVRHLLPV